ncbi:iron-containing alcohol dehydrogenase [Pelagovum pacificum]|uniref:Iron-containing alcohol dehydrogenase n=1 Tax=Pelagovum pacificum TaxID=2588711 RepID=A0A5C5GDD3_9RHOB|nr:iron-containing alcohol dehydrogenase [Pelagovum pacificum]QQA42466.1 iron-containing alcohol dehydrogenase [Pelagovum pacificum]TNY31549.1 iron-containing alcohol dehydrogenase [Pelagovum pacificum]
MTKTEIFPPIAIDRPARLVFGWGRVGEVGDFAHATGAHRTLVIADAFNADRVGLLNLPGEVTTFGTVKPEPDIENLESAREAAAACAPDLVVGFGGGSAMDLAKLVAVLVGRDHKLSDIAGPNRAPVRTVDLVQVPTTAGTGSEAGIRSLITDPETRSKVAVESRNMCADLALIDPELTATIPPAITATTGVDALAHCTEAFTSARAHPMIDLYAREGIRLAGQWLPVAVRNGTDQEARTAMSLASLYGGFCLGQVNTTAGHALSYPLGTRFGLPHGLANALIYPHTLAFNAPARPEKTAEIARALGVAESGSMKADVTAFCRDLGIEMSLAANGVTAQDLDGMAEEAAAIRRLLDWNPRDIGKDDIRAIYEEAL